MPIANTYQPSVPSTSSSQGSNVGNREDLSSMLTMLEPEQTPITSLCAKSKASGVLHEWIVDGLDTPSADGVSETSDVTSFSNKFANRARLGNYTQIFRKDYLVSDLQSAVSSVGPADVAQAKAKALREIKRDLEFAVASANDRQAEDGTHISFVVLVRGSPQQRQPMFLPHTAPQLRLSLQQRLPMQPSTPLLAVSLLKRAKWVILPLLQT